MPDIVKKSLRVTTSDGRYFVAKGRLWRRNNPALSAETRRDLTFELIAARSASFHARRDGVPEALARADARILAAKTALGQAGPPWWAGDALDLSGEAVETSIYRREIARPQDEEPES
jgi:hypothetical protein